jgi:hypothetical protein
VPRPINHTSAVTPPPPYAAQTPPLLFIPGDSVWIGADVRVQMTGLVDELVYLYLEAPCTHPLNGAEGFHLGAQCDDGICGHLLALLDRQLVCGGPVVLWFEDARWRIPGVRALRGIHLHLHPPMRCRSCAAPRRGAPMRDVCAPPKPSCR